MMQVEQLNKYEQSDHFYTITENVFERTVNKVTVNKCKMLQ